MASMHRFIAKICAEVIIDTIGQIIIDTIEFDRINPLHDNILLN